MKKFIRVNAGDFRIDVSKFSDGDLLLSFEERDDDTDDDGNDTFKEKAWITLTKAEVNELTQALYEVSQKKF